MINANAQITYYASDYLQIDDSLLYSTTTDGLWRYDFEETGQDFTWDYSDLTFEDQRNQTVFNPTIMGYKNTWCIANGYSLFFPLFNTECNREFRDFTNRASVLFDESDFDFESDFFDIGIKLDNVVAHDLLLNNVLKRQMLGLSIGIDPLPPVPLTFDYEDQDTLYQFPLEFTNMDSSKARLIMDFTDYIGIMLSFNSDRNNTVDGWGTLITPYETYTDVLRIRTVIDRNDTLFLTDIDKIRDLLSLGFDIPEDFEIQDTISVPITKIEYTWWDADHGLPVMKAVGTTIFGNEIILAAGYHDTARCVKPTSLFAYQPLLPVFDTLSRSSVVDFINFSQNADESHWDFGDGETSDEQSPSHTFTCPGLHFVELISSNTCDDLTVLSDTLTLPVIIRDTTNNFLTIDTTFVQLCSDDSVLINGRYITKRGIYFEIIEGIDGCDSILNIIGVHKTNINTDVAINEYTLVAEMDAPFFSEINYQWLDCNDGFSIIPDETSRFFTSETNGNYAVEISCNGCIDTSACYRVNPEGLEIPLSQGWNMISSYMEPEYKNCDSLFKDIANNMLLAKNSSGDLYFPSLSINTIGSWQPKQGYKIYMNEEDVLKVQGEQIIPEDTPIDLPEGWNWIAYLRDSEMSVIDAFAEIAENILLVKNNAGNMYFPSLNINILGDLVPGQGYMIYMMEEATLTYPANGSPRQALKGDELTPRATYIVPETKRTGNSMSLVIEIDNLLNGSEIGIWTQDNVLVGSGMVHNGKAAITVWGDNEQTDLIDGARELEGLKAIVFENESAMSYKIELGNIRSLRNNEVIDNLSYTIDDIILARAMTESSTATDDLLLTCKPNPTTGETVIEYSLESDSFVSIKLYSMSGQLVQTLSESETSAGLHTFNFNGSRLANGVYNLQMIVGGKSVNRLLVVSK